MADSTPRYAVPSVTLTTREYADCARSFNPFTYAAQLGACKAVDAINAQAAAERAEIVRAAKYEVAQKAYQLAKHYGASRTSDMLADLAAKYAPAPKAPEWREWVRPSDGARYRSANGTAWEFFGATTPRWFDYDDGMPLTCTRADFDSLAAFLNEHFPQDGAK